MAHWRRKANENVEISCFPETMSTHIFHLFSLTESFEQLATCCFFCTLMPAFITGPQTMKELAQLDGSIMVKETSEFSFWKRLLFVLNFQFGYMNFHKAEFF